jgi:carotenoid cleavage dioxygenase-like enzyme
MDVRFPDLPLYRGFGAPQRVESDIEDVEVVQGSIPEDLAGTLYRCGPDRQYPPLTGEDIFIDGEGMVSMFRFADGHADFRSRWVRNERFLLQEKARRSLFGRYRNRYTNDPSVAGKSMNTSNTHAFWHGGKLLVLKEDSLPVELDPDTLETRELWNFYGAVDAVSMTAHPKLDWARNEYLAFAYQARGDATKDFAFYVIDADGRVAHEIWFEMPYPGMVHDFAVTETHVVVPFFPLITSLETLQRGGPFYEWYRDEPSYYAVFPRRGSASDIRWFKGPTASAGHMMNAFDEGSRVHLDLCLYDGNCFEFFPSRDGSPWRPVPPLLTRLTFDLASTGGGIESKRLLSVPGEMPRCDDRYTGRPYRYGYMICRGRSDAAAGELAPSMLGRVDHRTGQFASWAPGETSGVQEAVFVPRRPGAEENDGYLLVPVNRYAENRNDLAILDAARFADEPIAMLKLPVRIKSFHGTWAPAEALRTGRYRP